MTKKDSRPRAITLIDFSIEAREKYAAEIFDIDLVFVEMEKLALQGFRAYRIQQQWALHLQATDAAAKLERRLKREHFSFSWVQAGVVADDPGNPTGERADFKELFITW